MTQRTEGVKEGSVGDLLRDWRQRRRLSQLDLAYDADISPRHLSFLETGRAQPSRAMVLRLAERLEVPLRERNAWLAAAGFAPAFRELPLSDPAMQAARLAVEQVLTGHEPYPALAVDRHWMMLAANRAVPPLLAGVASFLLVPPVNVLRLSLHPEGLAPRILNLTQWRTHLLERLRRQAQATGDPFLLALREELLGYGPEEQYPVDLEEHAGICVPLRLATEAGPLALFSTTTVFGAPADVTLSEIALEAFFPNGPESTATLHRLSACQVPLTPSGK